MAKRGPKNRHLKRLAAPKIIKVSDKKEKTFLKRQSPGPHSFSSSLPLVFALREMAGVVNTSREARFVLGNGKVRVDGKTRKKEDFPLGLMDVLDIDGTGTFRLWLDSKGRLSLVKDDKGLVKPLKIKNKVSVSKDTFQLTFHDGRTMLVKDNAYKVGDVLLVDLSDKSVKEHVKLAEGRKCLIVQGKHAGLVATYKGTIERGNVKEAHLQADDHEIITREAYLFPLPEGW